MTIGLRNLNLIVSLAAMIFMVSLTVTHRPPFKVQPIYPPGPGNMKMYNSAL